MDKEEIKKLLEEKNERLIDVLEINNKKYAKAICVIENQGFEFEYKYYEILKNAILEIKENELEKVKSFFGKVYGNVVY